LGREGREGSKRDWEEKKTASGRRGAQGEKALEEGKTGMPQCSGHRIFRAKKRELYWERKRNFAATLSELKGGRPNKTKKPKTTSERTGRGFGRSLQGNLHQLSTKEKGGKWDWRSKRVGPEGGCYKREGSGSTELPTYCKKEE